MTRVTLEVDCTIGSHIAHPVAAGSGPVEHGWPVGHAVLWDTLGEDGRQVHALVLMTEPALPGATVVARPVALMHVVRRDQCIDELLCVSEDPHFSDVVDLDDLLQWRAGPAAWAALAQRLQPGGAEPDLVGCEPCRNAEQLLTDAKHTFLEATGCLD
jgi:inorganic pyrophosphatase